jgi:spermidine/putrescine transport system permease protein
MPARLSPAMILTNRKSSWHLPSLIAILSLVLLMGVPLALTIWLSLRDPAGHGTNGLAWLTLFTSREAVLALVYSIAMGAGIAIASVACSLPLAYLVGVRDGVISRAILALLLVLWLLDPGIRILGWMQIIKSGTLAGFFPDYLMGSFIAEFAAGIHSWLPFAAILQGVAFARVPTTVLATARECGASSIEIFRRILWPRYRTWSTLSAGLIFCGATGGFLEPRLLGSSIFEQATEWLQRAMEQEIGWPYASAMLLALLAAAIFPALLLLGKGKLR